MKISDIGTEREKLKMCDLISKTYISCEYEFKCYFEKSNLNDGDILLKSPKTRNPEIRELKKSFSALLCEN